MGLFHCPTGVATFQCCREWNIWLLFEPQLCLQSLKRCACRSTLAAPTLPTIGSHLLCSPSWRELTSTQVSASLPLAPLSA